MLYVVNETVVWRVNYALINGKWWQRQIRGFREEVETQAGEGIIFFLIIPFSYIEYN